MSKLRSQLSNLVSSPTSINKPVADNASVRQQEVRSNGRTSENRRELEEIKQSLMGLTQLLTVQSANADQPVPTSPQESFQCNANSLDTDELAGSLSQTLRENLRDQMSLEIDKMRNELGLLQQSANEANDRAVLSDIQRISEGIHELQNRQAVSPDQFGDMVGELRGMHREIRDLGERPVAQFDATEITNSIQSSYDDIAKRLEGMGSSQVGAQFESLSEKLENLKSGLTANDPQMLVRIEEQLHAMGSGISALTQSQSSGTPVASDPALPEYFEGLDRRMEEITRAVMASATAGNISTDESAFDRIEARITSLAKTVENIALDNSTNPQLDELNSMPDQLIQAISGLEDRVSQLSASSGQNESEINEKFGTQLTELTQKIDVLNTASAAMEASHEQAPPHEGELGAKLDQLTLTLERAINSGDGSVGQLEGQIAELSNRVEQAVSTDQAEQQNRTLNESRIVEELQSLAARVELLDSSFANPKPENDQFSALENQINNIASQLQSVGGQPDLSAIENRLGGIEQQFETNREFAIEAANEAVKQAASRNENSGQSSAISAIAEDLQSLTRSSTELKGHSLETFDAVRDSLTMILDRINSIEMRIATEEHSSGFVEPIPAPSEEMHSAQMVDAAREYASNLDHENFKTNDQPEWNDGAGDGSAQIPEPENTGELPQVNAPSLDLQHMPPEGVQSVEAITLAGDDMPLEPGSGAPNLPTNVADSTYAGDQGPDMDSLMRQAKENKRKTTLEDDQKNPTDFIAAARRAAQAAANDEQESVATQEQSPKPKKKLSLGGLTGKRKKMVMFGAVALVAAALAIPAISYLKPAGEDQLAYMDSADDDKIEASNEDDIGSSNASLTSTPDTEINADVESPQDEVIPAEETVEAALDVTEPSDARQIVDTDTVLSIPTSPQSDAQARSMNSAETPAMSMITKAPMPSEEVGPIALRQAAASGNAKALFEVGRRYTKGVNGTPDMKEAALWYQRAADLGYAPAQYRLGNFYEKGHGVSSDVNQAAAWYKKSADNGNALAMHNLAVINAMGVLDGGANMVEASSWFKMAAEHGVKDSQVNLGIVYAKAMGVDVDLVQAYKWFAIAAKAGDKDAAQKRDTVAKQMRPDQLATARGEVELWAPKDINNEANIITIPTEWKAAPQITASLSNKQMVMKTQSILSTLGFKPGPADGLMGAKTIKAIKEFQSRAGIAVNGKVTLELLTALESSQS